MWGKEGFLVPVYSLHLLNRNDRLVHKSHYPDKSGRPTPFEKGRQQILSSFFRRRGPRSGGGCKINPSTPINREDQLPLRKGDSFVFPTCGQISPTSFLYGILRNKQKGLFYRESLLLLIVLLRIISIRRKQKTNIDIFDKILMFALWL